MISVGCASAPPKPGPDFMSTVRQPAPTVWVGGQPTAADLAQMRARGVTMVVNLRSDKETAASPYDERRAAEALGMRYETVPVAGAPGVTFANAGALARLLAEAGSDPVLLHCKSGNRVGALAALIAVAEGQDRTEALARGRRYGLTKLEPAVADVIDLCRGDEGGSAPACQGFSGR